MAVQQKAKCDTIKTTTKTRAENKIVTESQRQKMVGETAYYMAERRGFQSGHELEDWVAAERHVTAHLQRSSR